MSDYIVGTGKLQFLKGWNKKRAIFLVETPYHTLKGDYKELSRDPYTGEIEFQLDGTIKHNHAIRGSQRGREEQFSVTSVRIKNQFDIPTPAIKDLSGGKLLFSSDPDDPKNNDVRFEFRFAKNVIPPHALAAFCT